MTAKLRVGRVGLLWWWRCLALVPPGSGDREHGPGNLEVGEENPVIGRVHRTGELVVVDVVAGYRERLAPLGGTEEVLHTFTFLRYQYSPVGGDADVAR